ncbi:MAG: GNAT family N-acetyltransferase [Anaerolineales bacterium]
MMKKRVTDAGKLHFSPLTPEHWGDLVRLFGQHGATGGCWCMWWRITRAQFERNGNEGNRRAFKSLVDQGEVPGILAYRGSDPVGWCSVARREHFGALERSPVLRRVDDRPVWAIVCFFVRPEEQNQGIAAALLQAAVDYVRGQGGERVEAYPKILGGGRLPPGSIFMGTPGLYEKAGFKVVGNPSRSRLIMRLELD